ncbi:DUF3467 domain-containing protein [Roseiconus nitratireducens]|uniref:DUF3467 domain-containing protein n=1 Tax=Roseiconus nitratireducens TaxID=2605748 RepID=A0A5M6DG52_9BACT|nr:DUF3467 domain-containing protein [Roseiconus nitratireducens]KAA5545189.1 DUF3467 domain-containing protein [Roseiconus nitratireducens]
MSADDTTPDPPESGQPDSPSAPALRARVPDHVAGGTFSTGAIVMTGPTEFIVDFLQTIGRPHRVAARVIIPHPVMPQFIDALNTNLDLYRNRFGDPVTPQPQPPNPDARRPSPQEIYDDLKMPDEVMSGTYANGVMIGHGATEFGLDFLTSFFPQSAVSCRVFVAAGQVPRLLESLKGAVKQLEQRRQAGPSQPPSGENFPPPSSPQEQDGDSGNAPDDDDPNQSFDEGDHGPRPTGG